MARSTRQDDKPRGQQNEILGCKHLRSNGESLRRRQPSAAKQQRRMWFTPFHRRLYAFLSFFADLSTHKSRSTLSAQTSSALHDNELQGFEERQKAYSSRW